MEIDSANEITRKMSEGYFRGIISTSALEMGLDIDGLNIAIIADMPQEINSYQQRIGRVGRYGCKKSYVIVVRNKNSTASQLLFNSPDFDIKKVLPTYEPALYLEDKIIQNVHALCHVGDTDFMEYGSWRGKETEDSKFNHGDCFPMSFVSLCQDVLQGQESPLCVNLQKRCSGAPQYAYSLRTFGKQYGIAQAQGDKGTIPINNVSISRREVATEGFSGAIRFDYYKNRNIREEITGRDFESVYAKLYRGPITKTTSNKTTFLIPNFSQDFRFKTLQYGSDTSVFMLRVVEHIHIMGYYKHFFGHKEYVQYTTRDKLPNLDTTGTLIFHPALNNAGVKISDIAKLMFEAFIQRNAFDRNDINYIGGRLYYKNDQFSRGDKYIAFYDENENFNVTGRIANDDVLKDLCRYIAANLEVLASTLIPEMSSASKDALLSLCKSIIENTPDDDYLEIGKPRYFRMGSEVLYKENDTDEAGVVCMLAGYSDDNSECAIFLNGQYKTDIAISQIYPTANSTFKE